MDNYAFLKEYQLIYFDKLNIISINKCLNLYSEYFKSQQYEEHYAQGELIDTRNKRIESCLDKVLRLHSIFNDEYYKYSNLVDK